MAKAIVHKTFDATDITRGVSIRVYPSCRPQTLPSWVIAKGEAAGAAHRYINQTAVKAAPSKDE